MLFENYCSLAKESPWAEHLTSLPKRGVGALSIVSAFNHERVPMSVTRCPRSVDEQ